MAEINARTLQLSSGTDDGVLLSVLSGGVPVLTVSSDGTTMAAGVSLAAVSEPIEDVPEEQSADAEANAVAINAILAVLRDVGLVPPAPDD